MSEQKQRHWFLEVWLVLMIIANSSLALMTLSTIRAFIRDRPDIPWALITVMVFSILNVVCSIALFKWKKWGFWGLLFSSIVVFGVRVSLGPGPVINCVYGLIGIA